MDKKGVNKIPYEAPDGAVGYIEDITGEDYYVDPRIELYDDLEVQCYGLVCDFAELIGVNLDRNEVDYRLANHIRDTVVEMLETDFGIPFPSYGETNEKRNQRLQIAKKALDGFRAEYDKKQVIQLVGAGFETGHHVYDNFKEFKADLGDEVSDIDNAWAMYNEMKEYGPAGFYDEFRYDYEFSDDYIAEYGSGDDKEEIDDEAFDTLDEQISVAKEQQQKADASAERFESVER